MAKTRGRSSGRGRLTDPAGQNRTDIQATVAGWAQSMNDGQRSAFLHDRGNALVVAGAGTGKTRVLAHRVARLIIEQKAHPDEILVLTFTRDAAKEMRERIETLLKPFGMTAGKWMGTYHAILLKMMAPYPAAMSLLGGADGRFVDPAEDDEAKAIMEYVLDEAGWPIEPDPEGDPDPVGDAFRGISALKGWLATPDNVHEVATREAEAMVARGLAPPRNLHRAADIFAAYAEECRADGIADFDDITALAVFLLEQDGAIANAWRGMFKFMLEDEAQDTSWAQWRLAELLSADHGNRFVVGDEDQLLYGWRQADVGNMLAWADHPKVATYWIVDHYRCSRTTLEAAIDIISNNQARLGKVLQPATSLATGTPITLIRCSSSGDEAWEIADHIAALRSSGDTQTVAILVRLNKQVGPIREALRHKLGNQGPNRRGRASDPPGIVFKTIHGAKGLEFPHVILPGWADGIMPSWAAMREGREEDERCLAYVALTRGIDTVTITIPRSDDRRERPDSRFIAEIRPEHLAAIDVVQPFPAEIDRRPTRKQLAFARQIRGALDLTIADSVRNDRVKLSVWLNYWAPQFRSQDQVRSVRDEN